MTDTLFDVVLALAEELGDTFSGVATGGSTTTIVDTNLLTQQDDHWNGGTAFITYDAGGASAAPEKEFSPITDFVNSTNTVTLRDTLGGAVASGDYYLLTPGKYPLDRMISAVNAVLTGILIAQEDTTSLDIGDAQTEYTLPSAVHEQNLRQVWWETNDDANDPRWQEIRDWMLKPGGTGTQDTLIIPQLTDGYDLRLVYVVRHPRLRVSTDQINEGVHIDRVKYAAAAKMMVGEMQRNTGNPNVANLANYFRTMAAEAEQMHPVLLPPKNGRILVVDDSNGSDYTGEVGAVRVTR